MSVMQNALYMVRCWDKDVSTNILRLETPPINCFLESQSTISCFSFPRLELQVVINGYTFPCRSVVLSSFLFLNCSVRRLRIKSGKAHNHGDLLHNNIYSRQHESSVCIYCHAACWKVVGQAYFP